MGLDVSHDRRPTAEEALTSPWFTQPPGRAATRAEPPSTNAPEPQQLLLPNCVDTPESSQ
eukprot:NODE_11358_length_283_cov_157.438596.p4 GENE.NODE_11358_length_283_cov_157.438596~~NODE_11358_length_283_cov_157.438596.p4  ORF type:complete len:60 (-),score=3.32 NODE_11358_length_283_cov_157.438596:86-265(-)